MEASDFDKVLEAEAERIRSRFKHGNEWVRSFKYLSAEDRDILTRDALQNHEYRIISKGVYVAEENFGEKGKKEDVLNREIDDSVLMRQLGIVNEIYIVPEGIVRVKHADTLSDRKWIEIKDVTLKQSRKYFSEGLSKVDEVFLHISTQGVTQTEIFNLVRGKLNLERKAGVERTGNLWYYLDDKRIVFPIKIKMGQIVNDPSPRAMGLSTPGNSTIASNPSSVKSDVLPLAVPSSPSSVVVL